VEEQDKELVLEKSTAEPEAEPESVEDLFARVLQSHDLVLKNLCYSMDEVMERLLALEAGKDGA
jgi:hypothetical protein